MRLEPVVGDDPREILRSLRSALHGAGPALGLGMVRDAPTEVPAGTAVVVTTSGSTGVPKSVVLTRDALTAGALATADRIGDGAWLLALPPSYVAGLQVLVRSIVADREPAWLTGGFTPGAFTAAALMMLSTDRGTRVPTYTSLVPAQLTTLLDAAASDESVLRGLRSFEQILVGGQAVAPATLERALDAGVRVVRTYGATETSGGCVYDGRPLRGVSVRIVEGEIQVAGPTLAEGYLGDPGATDLAFPRDPDGTRWYRTGDAGILEDDLLRVRGRIDNVIVSGGINVSLDRVERVVRSIPGLESAVVVGVPDARWGEASVAVVPRGEALRRSESVQLEEARAAVTEEIGAHARPNRLVLVDEIATLPSGKPDREAIRAAVVALHRP
ncbi:MULTISPECIES: AMP-binding protein [unclassified Microbacterium]|uniref:AMP-binding protein n=1 Tax=unclassified Microbacterium TaxID=2609290 RepID=UPI00214A970B|nr:MULTISPECIES: AMP-binding protein [unclassified Microbacterium]MCR2810822.1 AMP-binding protein [Microbacterium sp. zg.B185]WIM19772.1 AMP-binding protein [Microbacterium sp. zg-B185]